MNDASIAPALQQVSQYLAAGQLTPARHLCESILASFPQHAKTLHLLGFVAMQEGQFEVAMDMLSRSVTIDPNDSQAQYHLGNALIFNRQYKKALDLYQQLTRAFPNHAASWAWLGIALFEMELFDQSVAAFVHSIKLDPNNAETRRNYASALFHSGRSAQSALEASRAIALNPKWHGPYLNLANALKDCGQLDDAIAALRKGLALKPDWAIAHGNLAYGLYFLPNYSAAAIAEEHRRWNQTHAEPLKAAIQPHTNDRTPDRRLRIGYVAPNFKEHCQSFFTLPLLCNHDRRQFEIFCYADVPEPDHVTRRIQAHPDVWRSTAALSDDQLVELIRADRIDILVDLTMHMSNGRLFVFARKPAPVQVTWLGYPGTTGLTAIDYRLTDPYLDPPGQHDEFYSEQSIRLPDTFWCYDPLTNEPQVNSPPMDANGHLTFGCLNNFCKVNVPMLKLWERVMLAVPDSRLLLLSPQGEHRGKMVAQLGAISPQRIEMVDRCARAEYLQLYHRIDLCLDTYPYNGHTTTLDSYWMGVPTVSLCGETAVSRAGLSQASNLGLQEFVAHSPDEFVQIATKLANDRARLRELRATLRQRMMNSPLMDGPRFARGVEGVYQDIWRRWCSAG